MSQLPAGGQQAWSLTPPGRTRMELADCAAEPIRTPGSIQPHGRLVVLTAYASCLLAFGGNLDASTARDAMTRIDTSRIAALDAGAPPVSLGTMEIGSTQATTFRQSVPIRSTRCCTRMTARRPTPR